MLNYLIYWFLLVLYLRMHIYPISQAFCDYIFILYMCFFTAINR